MLISFLWLPPENLAINPKICTANQRVITHCVPKVPGAGGADPAWVGSSGRVVAWKENGRFLLGCVTADLSLRETKPYPGVGFTDTLVNSFFNSFLPPLLWVVYPSSVMKHIAWQFQFILVRNASSFELSKGAYIIGTWFIFHALWAGRRVILSASFDPQCEGRLRG